MEKGRFITIEGLDGAGTTTQANMLAAALERTGGPVWLTGEPTCGPVGSLVRQVLQERVRGRDGGPFSRKALALLFAADRLDHCDTRIKPLLEQGVTVISDRYVYSSFAYQVQDAPQEWVQQINQFALTPELVIFLDITPEIAMERVKKRKSEQEIFEHLVFQEKVRRQYLAVLEPLDSSRKLFVDGNGTKEDVHRAILAGVNERFGYESG